MRSAGGYNDWPVGRGIFFNKDKTFLVWVNEEDHLRLISMQKGGNLKQIYTRLVTVIYSSLNTTRKKKIDVKKSAIFDIIIEMPSPLIMRSKEK